MKIKTELCFSLCLALSLVRNETNLGGGGLEEEERKIVISSVTLFLISSNFIRLIFFLLGTDKVASVHHQIKSESYAHADASKSSL